MKFPLADLETFGTQLLIPAKESEGGLVPLAPYFGTQKYLLREIAAGWERGVHDFYVLKGRQQGISTICEVIDLYWPQKYRGVQGQVVVPDDDTLAGFRDVIREMMRSMPDDWRLPVAVDNDKLLRWGDVTVDGKKLGGSRLFFQVAGATTKKKKRLGRSRGLNYLHATELPSWTDHKGVTALEASLAETNPRRFYLWESTAGGFDVWHEMWTGALTEPSQKAIFIGWYHHETYQVARGTEVFDAYGTKPRTAEERQWIAVVKRRYGVEITDEQLCWYRWQLVAKFRGDEMMLAQEHPCVHEDAFQAFGTKFIRPATLQRLRIELESSPAPSGYAYEWGQRLDLCPDPVLGDVHDAPLTIWEEPDPLGAYLIGAVPMGSHDPDSTESAATVWRIYPDSIVQVAEYVSEDDATYQFAWALLHLGGAYHCYTPPFLALELQGTGRRVYEELIRFADTGFGLSEAARVSKLGLADFLGNVRHYLYRRWDTMTRTASRQWLGTPSLATVLMHELRDQVERGYLVIRSAALLNELAMLRQGEDDDGDSIKAGGLAQDARVVSAAIAVRHYVETALPEITSLIPPKAKHEGTPPHMAGVLVGTFFGNIVNGGRRR